MSKAKRIVVCGAGAWGTAMAMHCARQGLDTVLAPRRPEQALLFLERQENLDYLPGYRFPEGLSVDPDLASALLGAEALLLGVPSYALRDWCRRIAAAAPAETLRIPVVSLAKGLELSSRRTPTAIVKEELPAALVACLSGPTFAGEVAAGKPTAMTLACGADGADACAQLQESISGPNLRVYLSDDLAGVELGGCLKNVYAIAAGCCQGLELGDNALASLLTRSLAEMVRVGQSLGAKAETFYGLSGIGDLVATCHGPWSRNRSFGEAIARGADSASLIANQKTAVEGYRTVSAFHQECSARSIEAPILEQVYRICYEAKPPIAALGALMSRDLKRE